MRQKVLSWSKKRKEKLNVSLVFLLSTKTTLSHSLYIYYPRAFSITNLKRSHNNENSKHTHQIIHFQPRCVSLWDSRQHLTAWDLTPDENSLGPSSSLSNLSASPTGRKSGQLLTHTPIPWCQRARMRLSHILLCLELTRSLSLRPFCALSLPLSLAKGGGKNA